MGWLSDLNNMTIDDLRDWYHRWYTPNNAIVVVVGDVDPEKTFQLVKHYFGRIKPAKMTPLKPLIEPPFLTTRKVTVAVPAKLPMIMMGYNVPSYDSTPNQKEVYALDVLSGILDGGSSSRL